MVTSNRRNKFLARYFKNVNFEKRIGKVQIQKRFGMTSILCGNLGAINPDVKTNTASNPDIAFYQKRPSRAQPLPSSEERKSYRGFYFPGCQSVGQFGAQPVIALLGTFEFSGNAGDGWVGKRFLNVA